METNHMGPSAPGFAGGFGDRGTGESDTGGEPSARRTGQRVLATMVTTTSYGTWLPGDLRGFVRDGVILPGEPKRLDHARTLLVDNPVYFTRPQIIVLDLAIRAAVDEFGYRLTDLSIESWHLHWIVDHGYDPVPDMVGRLKTRMRQMIGRGRIWTEGYCHRCLEDEGELRVARGYVARHAESRMVDGKRVV